MRAFTIDSLCRESCRHVHPALTVARAPPAHCVPHTTTRWQWQQQSGLSKNQLQPLKASDHTGSDPSPSPQGPTPIIPPLPGGSQGQPGKDAPPVLPSFMDGINWYCYSCLGLLFLTDLTPLGQWLLASSDSTAATSITSFPVKLAALQWAAFVVPTLFWIQRAGWDLSKTLRLQQPPAASRNYYITGLLAGPALWLAINTAIALRTGNTEQLTAALSGGVPSAVPTGLDGATISPGMLLLGVGGDGSSGVGVQQAALLLLFAAVSPAVAEELLFRGFLLTALQQRLGSIDAAAVAAALFALIHLDFQQFFLYCVLGGACGLLAVQSGSVWPAVVLHAGFNATAVATALLLHR